MNRQEDVYDVPKLANAAQMASRNIKTAKGGRRPRPIQSNSAPQSMSFGAGDGGLFGGSVQGSGSFEFAAPDLPKVQFPRSPYGAMHVSGPIEGARKETEKNWVDTSALSPYEDKNSEEEMRRKKPFQSTSSSNTFAPSSSSAPTQSSIFGGQQSFGFNSMNGQAQQPSNPFTFQTTSQAASPGLGAFNSSSTQNNPASNIFSFTAPSSQPASPSPSITFGSGPTQNNSTSNMFTFSQPQAQPAQTSSSIFNFGSPAPAAAQNQPINNPFASNQTTTQTPSSGIFASAPATQAPNSNFFGNQNPSTSGINFGSTPATATPTTSMFATSSKPLFGVGPSEGQQNTQPSSNVPKPNMFGTSPSMPSFGAPQQPAPTPPTENTAGRSLFDRITTVPPENQGNMQPTSNASTTNIFGTSSSMPHFGSGPQQSAPSPKPFSQLNAPAPQSNNFFGSQSEPQPAQAPNDSFGGYTTANAPPPGTSTLYSNLNKPAESPAPFGSIFSKLNQSTQPTSNLLGNLNKPTEQQAPQVNGTPVNGTGQDTKTMENSTSSLHNKTPSANMFGGFSMFPTPTSQKETQNAKGTPNFSFGPSQSLATSTQANATSQSSPMKPVDAPSSANQPPPSGMFPSLPPPSSKNSQETSSKSMGSTAITNTTNERSSASNALIISNGTTEVNPDSLYPKMAEAVNITEEYMSSLLPAGITSEKDKKLFYAAFRLRMLNKALQEYMASIPFSTCLADLFAHYNNKKVEIQDFNALPVPGSKRRLTDVEEQEIQNPSKRSRQNGSSTFPQPPANKSKTSDERDEEQEIEHTSKPTRSDAASRTNIFQAAQPQNQTTKSPEKSKSQSAGQPQPYLNGSTPKATSLAPPPSFAPPTTSSSSSVTTPSTKGKRKAEVQLTKDDHEREEQEGGRMKTPKMNGDTNRSITPNASNGIRRMKTPKMKGDTNGSNTSNIFKGIVDSPEKKVAPLTGASPAENAPPRANPFGTLPVPKSQERDASRSDTVERVGSEPSKSTGAPNPDRSDAVERAGSNMFAKEAATVEEAPTPAPNMFAPKPAAPSQSGPPKFGPPQSGPPKFGGPAVDFFAQFQAKAKARDEINEHNLMVKAMEEDLDSDDDEETREKWKAEWTAKRKAKLEELENISKRGLGGLGFVPTHKEAPTSSTNPFAPKPSPAAPNMFAPKEASTPSTNIFAPKPTQSSSNSPFSSRASTPGLFGSNKGSVLDGHTPGTPPISGADNIFGHLEKKVSDVESGPADEETASESGGEEDSENKDPNYVPGNDESGSGSGSAPGTPVEETGAGIASAKKATASALFGASPLGGVSGAGSPSGTSSPSRSIFDTAASGASASGTTAPFKSFKDRVSQPPVSTEAPDSGTSTPFKSLKDRVTQAPVPTENKENNKPTTTNGNNLFAGLNKSPASPADHTWKPDTPIKFGSASSPTNTAFPTVNVTEATPTKPAATSIFANLGGSSTLFGSSSPKTSFSPFVTGGSATPGFNFGTPAASLLPSAAASTTTSRATSPGNTTDGASDDQDGETEKHEQLDLTAGGPGEEDEDVIHEVRSKALQWVPAKDSIPGSWKNMGVGILRVLKHKESSATRVVIRGDPSGKIILNKGLLPNIDYKPEKKTVKFVAAAEGGLETWLLQVKTEEVAQELARVLQENK